MGRVSKQVSVCALILLAGGCGGGGSNIREVPFTSFQAVQPNTRVVMSGGISTTVTGTYTGSAPNILVQTVNAPVEDLAGASTQKLTYDGNKALSGMAFSTPSGSASFSRGGGTDWFCNSGVCSAQTSSALALVIDGTVPAPNGWNYQTFGVWETTTSTSTFQAGALSAGTVTPASAVPTSGNPTFTGVANGFYIDPAGIPFFAAASMTAVVDWNLRTIGFSTSGTKVVNMNTAQPGDNFGLNLNGNFIFPVGSSQFSGQPLSSANGMTGTANGRFYGPGAEEIGGTFSLQGFGVERMIGGFGGRRP